METLLAVGARLVRLRCVQSVLVLLFSATFTLPTTAQDRPNFLIIVADDLGWSDPGFLGSSIRTPNIDALAESGTFLSDFYVAPTCSPTRAMLLTGVSNHAAGVGTMNLMQTPEQAGRLEYAAQLHDGVATLAEVFQANGYATAMAGKWHLSIDETQHPHRRGFDKSFGLVEGGASHFADQRQIHRSESVTYLEDGNPVDLESDFYSTYAYTDKIIDYIQASEDQPFFAYLAYTAPHDPLQVPDSWLNRYHGEFDSGPAAEKARRAAKLVQLGLLDERAEIAIAPNAPRWLDGHKKPWNARNEITRKSDARRMEIYAAMVELMDEQIGRVIAHLVTAGRLENTYIIFMSDNGASAGTPYTYPGNNRAWVDNTFDLTPDQMGKIGSFTTMGADWANASNTPFRFFKISVAEGGVRSPLLVSGPGIPRNKISSTPAHVMDLAPTIYEIANIDPANERVFGSKKLPTGQSLLPTIQSEQAGQDRTLVTELWGNRMVRQERWKAIYLTPPFGSGKWELFDISIDPSAQNNLATEYPELVDELREAYEKFALENNVIAPQPALKPRLISLYEGPCGAWCKSKYAFAEAMLNPVSRTLILSGIFLTLSGIFSYVIYRLRTRG